MPQASDISDRILEAVMARKLPPGSRLGEQQLAILFDCSRTIVREALTRLAARGIVTVAARRGWYVVEPTQDEAREAFEARRVIETGLIRGLAGSLDPTAVKKLRAHVAREQAAIRGDDVGLRSFLLGDFHVCLADCLGGPLLADILRDLTARTTLIATLFQSSHDAAQSCADHARIGVVRQPHGSLDARGAPRDVVDVDEEGPGGHRGSGSWGDASNLRPGRARPVDAGQPPRAAAH